MSRAEFYRLVSGVIRGQMDKTDHRESRAAWFILTLALADAFAKHNTKFDAARFMRDAGFNDQP